MHGSRSSCFSKAVPSNARTTAAPPTIPHRRRSSPNFEKNCWRRASTYGQAAAIHASLRVLSGSSTGLEMPVVKAVTTFGKPGVAIVALSHRRNGYYVAVMEGGDGPLLNGRAIGPEPTLLNEGDELELAGTRMRFKLKA